MPRLLTHQAIKAKDKRKSRERGGAEEKNKKTTNKKKAVLSY
jgi:hypothetical protein